MFVHPKKCEYMILKQKRFVGPLQEIKLCNISVKRVYKTRCLGLIIDSDLKFSEHVNDILVSFVRKVNLLKSMQFLPKLMLQDFYNKVILPSITYGILVWGSCNVTLFDRIEKMHARAAKIIYRLHWTTEAGEALLKAGWKSLGWHYKHRLVGLSHKCYTGSVVVFTKRIIKAYNLRGQNRLSLPLCVTEIMVKSIVYRVSVLWNKLPNYCQECSYTTLMTSLKDSDFFDTIPWTLIRIIPLNFGKH